MKILALIPARSGSKRLPNKNTRMLGNKPLITWTINAAKALNDICDVLVSTDSEVVAEIAKASGANVPWLRPIALAGDSSSLVDVCFHALDWYESAHGEVDAILLLQPTSPFRSLKMMMQGIDLFKLGAGKTVVGVSLAQSHPLWCFKLEKGSLQPYVSREGLGKQSQDLLEAYVVNGSFYLFSPKNLRDTNTILSAPLQPLISNELAECIDIDTERDWFIAESFLSKYTML